MTRHVSASVRNHESHIKSQKPQFQTSNTRTFQIKSEEITPDLKRRARMLAVDGRVHQDTRRLIRYALQDRDPYLVQLVTRVEAGERRIDHLILDTD